MFSIAKREKKTKMGMKSRSRGGEGSPNSLLFWGFLLLISNNLFLPVVSLSKNNFGDQKNYFSSPADPHFPSGVYGNPTPTRSHNGSKSTHHHSHGSSPSSSGSQSNCNLPSTPPPFSGGSGSSGGSSGGCRCPSPSPSHGGGSSSGGSGGYYHDPPTPKTPVSKTPPSPLVPSPPFEPPVVTPTPRPSFPPPSRGGGGYYGPPNTPSTPATPSSPLVPSPPFVPIVPAPPLVPPTPTSPVPFDPNTPPFPCTFWGSHPALIFGVLGWWGTVGGLFGMTTFPGLNSADATLEEVLNNPRRDGYASLYREATAAILNSMAGARNFPFSSNQVKASLIASLHSDKAAAQQARLFRLANQGKLKHVDPTTSDRP